MEIKKVSAEMRKGLNKPLPPEAVKPHPTKTYLSSIKAIYVTERLNDVFGVGSWTLKADSIERATGGTIVIKAILEIPEYGIYLESFGGNDNGGENSKNFDLGDAYKGATTDAITKICSYLEIGIDVFKGLANKSQAKTTPPPPPPAPVGLTDAIKNNIKGAKSKEDLTAIWNNNKGLQTDENFISIIKDRRSDLTPVTA